MRLRSLCTAFAMSCLLAGAVLRCSVPPLTPGPQILPTRQAFPHGAFLSLPPGTVATVDRPALVASLRELKFSTIIIQATANPTGEVIADRVALAVALQQELED